MTIYFSEQLRFKETQPSSERERANHAKIMHRKDAQCNILTYLFYCAWYE